MTVSPVDTVKPVAPAGAHYDGILTLPGFGTSPERCRQVSPVGFCEDRGHPVIGRSSCGTSYCPDHWRDWCARGTELGIARLAAFREAQPEGMAKRLVHLVASPDQDRTYGLDDVFDTRSEAYEVLTDCGVRGGLMVTHAHRTTDRLDSLYATAIESGDIDEDYGKWRFAREIAEDTEDLARWAEPAPHYHVLAAVEDLQPGNAPDDWIVQNIRSFSPFHKWDSDAYQDMAAGLYYVRSHAPTTETGSMGRQTTTYFGDVHPATFKPEDELTATTWARIQDEAAAAVDPWDAPSGGEGATVPDECPHDGCESGVLGILELATYLEDRDWVDRLKRQDGGYVRWLQLRGLQHWHEGGDRPPPVDDVDRVTEWLEQQGRKLSGPREQRQVGLGSFDPTAV